MDTSPSPCDALQETNALCSRLCLFLLPRCGACHGISSPWIACIKRARLETINVSPRRAVGVRLQRAAPQPHKNQARGYGVLPSVYLYGTPTNSGGRTSLLWPFPLLRFSFGLIFQ